VVADPIRIGNTFIGPGYPCYIVGEIGVSHNGDIGIARQLMQVAMDSGANAVKFQKRTVNAILTRAALDEPYSGPNSFGRTYGEHRHALELSQESYRELFQLSVALGLTFLCSGWDKESVDFMDWLGVPAFKVASADLTNIPLIHHTAAKMKPVILSTGMGDMHEIGEAVTAVRSHHDQLILLQCTSTYPCDNKDVNLRAMNILRDTFDCPVGYSGHERGLAPSEAAACMGAVMVERHFTLDRTMRGPDHAASLEPKGLALLVRNIRMVEEAKGTGQKVIMESTVPARKKLGKSLVSNCDIPPGTVILERMLDVKGPGDGISPGKLDQVLGRVSAVHIPEDTTLYWSSLVPRPL